MGPFRTRRPKRVVRLYGFENVLVAMNLLLSAFMRSLGLWPPRESEVLRRMERDAKRMIDRGYRIVSSEHFDMPLFGLGYERVVYELLDTPKSDRHVT